jgi:regulator of sigma E protease
MTHLLGFLASIPDLLLVILGFGFIIFIHELGHFFAAKWAGIRVLAFAIGFGPPVASYRKGMGLRLGRSTEPEYRALEAEVAARMSPTEYRLNWLPLGGYVKMLGQDDLRPGATSKEPDSYQNIRPWKRMVVISAGVVMNIILAAFLFVAVFMTGLKTEPAEIGAVLPDSPAATALAKNGARLGVTRPGLRPGDVVVSVNGRKPAEFTDLVLAAAMSRRDQAVNLLVQREGVARPLEFDIIPRVGEQKLLEMGLYPASSAKLHALEANNPNLRLAREWLASLGLAGVEPGMTLVSADGQRIDEAADLSRAVEASNGRPVALEFASDAGQRVTAALNPEPELELALLELPSGMKVPVRHLLGITPVMKVADDSPPAQGLQPGDIFVRLGTARYPSIPEGMAEIHAHRGGPIEVTVLREVNGAPQHVEIQPPPKVNEIDAGQIGFRPDSTAKVSMMVARVPKALELKGPAPATELVTRPGMRITAIAGAPVSSFAELRSALVAATRPVIEQNGDSGVIPITIALPGSPEEQTQTVSWTLTRADIQRLHGLGWESPLSAGEFEPKQYLLQAENPLQAVRMGVAKTHRVMMMTYLTFARLFEGTVKVEHLKGPVGIAQMGTKVAERGPVWLLFFMALISVNLAVINFLPLPIVDGGQFVFLVVEQIRGKPVSVQVQNAATAIGVLLIGTMFIIVTFHDIMNLFG